jgi:competence protein ComEC
MESPKEALFKKITPFGILFALLLGIYTYTGAPAKAPTGLEVDFLDVGQGDSALVKTPNGHYYLVDGGPDKKVLEQMGAEIPFSKNLDGIILTHPHADHVAGLNYVLDRYRVGRIYMTGATHTAPDYVSFLDKIKEKNIPAEETLAGKGVDDGEVKFNYLWPPKDKLEAKDLNDTSLVLRLSYQNTGYLFLGDLSEKAQNQMLAETKIPESQVLKVSHHGSKTGTSTQLLESVKPIFAVISVGKGNDFGHPAPLTLTRLVAQTVLRTDELGKIRLFSDGKTVRLLK